MNTYSNNRMTLDDVVNMVRHWCITPAGTYLGDPYGHEFKKDLQHALTPSEGQGQLSKLVQDVPYIAEVGNVELFTRIEGNDKLIHVIQISGQYGNLGSFDIGGF